MDVSGRAPDDEPIDHLLALKKGCLFASIDARDLFWFGWGRSGGKGRGGEGKHLPQVGQAGLIEPRNFLRYQHIIKTVIMTISSISFILYLL